MSEKKGYDGASEIQDYTVFGEFGGVNPSITDSSTFTFLDPHTMDEIFDHEIEGCFLYSRHWNPSNKYLAGALAALEGTESAQVTGSGMAAIACTVLQLCGSGDHVVSGRTIYGGTYAFFKNFLPRLGIDVTFVDLKDPDAVRGAMTERTKLVYGETISNPLLEVANVPELADIAHARGVPLVIDNTFSPMVLSPVELGADIVVHSLTKYINGASDCVGGCICASDEFVHQLTDINSGATMLLGPVLDSFRSASILKNLHTLHVRMQKHSANAMFLARELEGRGYTIHYPGLPSHPQHELLERLRNPEFGHSGMVAVDTPDHETALRLMSRLQEEKVGLLAVSLGYYKTLFSSPASSTSSEIPKDEQEKIGLRAGIVRMSVGLDHDIGRTLDRILGCLEEVGVPKNAGATANR